MAQEIFRTVHGSRLYGFSHSGSDQDFFIVTDSESKKVSHRIIGELDFAEVGFKTFMELAMSGSHQSAEAMFSPYKEYTEFGQSYAPMIESAVLAGGDLAEKFERTIRKFAFEDFKRRRHGVRLSIHLASIRATGKFSPVLTAEEVEYATRTAELLEGAELLEELQVPRHGVE